MQYRWHQGTGRKEDTMLIGIPKEIKNHEYRVGMTPASVREMTHHGHRVLVETRAGEGIGCDDEAYRAAGASVVDSAAEIFARAEMIVKVKEPQPAEYQQLHAGQLLFTYLHLAPDPEQTKGLLASGCTAIAYETITDTRGGLPLLAPMSEVAGRMAIQVGAVALQKTNGGRGVLLGGVAGVLPGKVVVLGGGVVGTNAARMALGLGADVTVVDRSTARLTTLDELYGPRLKTLAATQDAIEEQVLEADLVVGAVLVDVAIDQGGCFDTSRPTTHADPTYIVDGIVHYCVANMPGAVARTSTFALNNATLPFALALANKGWRQACTDNLHLRAGLSIHAGQVTYAAVATDLGYPYLPAEEAIAR
jgi:alanine dehydrogenase